MTSDPSFILNGRFLTRSLTGVDRVATELSLALLDILQQDKVRLLLPKTPIHAADTRPQLLLDMTVRPTPAWSGYLWEQLALSFVQKEAWLLSLCNMGPVMRSRQAVMIHDAQIFTQPEAYSAKFRLVYHNLIPRIAKHARVVLTVSDFSRRELEKLGVVPEGKTTVIHNGVDHIDRITTDSGTLARHNLTKGAYFLAIGSIAPHKNLPMLIEAARNRSDTSIPLIIAGGGNASVFRGQGLSEGNGVQFLGRVSDGELKALYSGALAQVFPSKTEGFGLPPLEAMACGCPVIATTGGAVPEVCGEAAIFADPNQPNEWTDAMDMLAGNPKLCADLAQAGRARAAQFTWVKAAETMLQAIESAHNAPKS
jgi:glycosyltransferase involved in cell wall biosynthesis